MGVHTAVGFSCGAGSGCWSLFVLPAFRLLGGLDRERLELADELAEAAVGLGPAAVAL